MGEGALQGREPRLHRSHTRHTLLPGLERGTSGRGLTNLTTQKGNPISNVIMPERTTISATPDRFEPIWIDPGVHPTPGETEGWAQHLLLIAAEIRSAA